MLHPSDTVNVNEYDPFANDPEADKPVPDNPVENSHDTWRSACAVQSSSAVITNAADVLPQFAS